MRRVVVVFWRARVKNKIPVCVCCWYSSSACTPQLLKRRRRREIGRDEKTTVCILNGVDGWTIAPWLVIWPEIQIR